MNSILVSNNDHGGLGLGPRFGESNDFDLNSGQFELLMSSSGSVEQAKEPGKEVVEKAKNPGPNAWTLTPA